MDTGKTNAQETKQGGEVVPKKPRKKKKMMLSSEKMIAIIGKKIKLSTQAEIRRTYAGRHQLAAGGWAWFVYDPNKPGVQVGGFTPIADLVKCPKLDITFVRHESGGIEIECSCIGPCKGLLKRKK